MPVEHGGTLTRRGGGAGEAAGRPGRRRPARPGAAALDALRARYDRATAGLDPPLALVDLAAFDRNAADVARRAAGRPIRVATKSLRCRYLIERALASPGYRGLMCYSLAEALWLHAAGASDDLLVAYRPRTAPRCGRWPPTTAPGGTSRSWPTRPAHLDLVDRALGDGHPELRVCLDLDVSWRPLAGRPQLHIGTRRSPLHTPRQAAVFAATIAARAGFRLVGVMGYEGQIAGLGDAPPGHPLKGALIRLIQGRSAAELSQRRAAAIRLISAVTSLELVNGGGTGSLELTARDPSVTEVTAGSGLVGPTLFDAYSRFTPQPALLFALPVVRRPGAGFATVFAGGYVASGAGTPDRLPRPYLPAGLRLTGVEGAGEVQTPVRGRAAGALRPGDRVWLRHAKAGELAERFGSYHVLGADGQVTAVPTYRGEGRCFG
jgi:D-serine deaminase-like pyridoxal phosphate-dependent protein